MSFLTWVMGRNGESLATDTEELIEVIVEVDREIEIGVEVEIGREILIEVEV